MKIGVMGAGAVGCYYGALLAKSGHGVTMVGRQPFVDAVTADGLRLETARSDERVSVTATLDAALLGEADIVLLSVKSADTETAGRAFAPYLRPGAAILTFQNGVDNADRLASVLDRPVIPAVVYVAAGMIGPGHVRHNGRGDLIIGPAPQSETIAAMFTAAGAPTTVSPEVREALWRKLIVNCAYNAMSAVAQISYGPLLAVDGVRNVMADVVAECLAVGRAMGVALDEADMVAVFSLASTMPDQLSSTAQDMARRKPTEIDYINGYVCRMGRQFSIATPANQTLHVLVKLMEASRAARPGRSE